MTATANAPAASVTLGGELTVGRIGYGAMQLTGPKVWGEYPDHERALALLKAVVESGVTFIDTADVYGPHSNEELIREALHPYPDDAGVVFSPWHPAAVPGGDDSARIRAVLDPIAARTGGTVQQVALAWQLHRSPRMLPIPGTTSIAHLKDNLASTEIRLTPEDVDTITGLMPEDEQPAGRG